MVNLGYKKSGHHSIFDLGGFETGPLFLSTLIYRRLTAILAGTGNKKHCLCLPLEADEESYFAKRKAKGWDRKRARSRRKSSRFVPTSCPPGTVKDGMRCVPPKLQASGNGIKPDDDASTPAVITVGGMALTFRTAAISPTLDQVAALKGYVADMIELNSGEDTGQEGSTPGIRMNQILGVGLRVRMQLPGRSQNQNQNQTRHRRQPDAGATTNAVPAARENCTAYDNLADCAKARDDACSWQLSGCVAFALRDDDDRDEQILEGLQGPDLGDDDGDTTTTTLISTTTTEQVAHLQYRAPGLLHCVPVNLYTAGRQLCLA